MELKTKKKRYTLKECPAGLFLFEGTLCLKTEYHTELGAPECYVAISGEYFIGGEPDYVKRNKLKVTPIKIKT